MSVSGCVPRVQQWMGRAGLLLTLMGMGCDAPVSEAYTPPAEAGDGGVAVAAESLQGGIVGEHRREIVSFGGCTGTLIGPRWVITAAHCFRHQDFVNDAGNPDSPHLTYATVRTSADGRSWGAAPGETFVVERSFSFANDTVLGATDVLLLRLARPVPAAFISAFPPLATAVPTSGTEVTAWGLGCNNANPEAAGRSQYVEYEAGASSITCPGDSGGPRRLGAWNAAVADSAIWGVNSSYPNDGMGLIPPLRSRIIAMMQAWDGPAGATDISVTQFCTHSTAELFWGDIDADGDFDAICHDTSRTGGARWIARQDENRIVALAQSLPGDGNCTGTDEEMHVGDFNGDRRTDLLCVTKSTGRFRVDYADAGGAYETTYDWDSGASGWCTHAGSRLHLGDFNRDGRTDIACKDSQVLDIEAALTGGTFNFSDWGMLYLSTTWCTGSNDVVVTGDFDRDERTDLLCLNRATGALNIMFARASGDPFPGTTERHSGTPPSTFCRTGDVLTVIDADGDGGSDLSCRRPDGTSFDSFRSRGPGGTRFNFAEDPATPWNDTDDFGHPRQVRPRARPVGRWTASEPWRRPRPL